MAKRVYVFGAGASRTMKVPLLKEFINAADDLRKKDGRVSKEAFEFFFDAYENYLPDLEAKTKQDLDDIETVFSLVEMARLIRRFPKVESDQIEKLSDAIR